MNTASKEELIINKNTFEAEAKRLSDILRKESSSSVEIVQEIMHNLDENNIVSFVRAVFSDKPSSLYNSRVLEELEEMEIINSIDIKNQIMESSEVSLSIIISAIETIAEGISNFMTKTLRAIWGTENKICGQCGNEYTSKALFCDQCGSELTNNAWDSGMRLLTTDILKGIMSSTSRRFYTIKSKSGRIYGSFYKSNTSDRDLAYIITALEGSGIEIDETDDRIYFDIREENLDKKLYIIKDLADQMRFQEISNLD